MSIARHHNEWLSLVPNSGPFLSLPVLADAFPQGLDAHDPDHARRLRMAFDEWDENQLAKRPDPGMHRAWIKFVLEETLGYNDKLAEGQAIPQTLKSEIAEYGETLRPDFVVNDPATKKARLLIQIYPRSQSLTKPVQLSRWKTSPDTRMMQLLHDTGIRLGIVTNGDTGCWSMPRRTRRPAMFPGTQTCGWRSRSRCGPSAPCSAPTASSACRKTETLEALLDRKCQRPAGSHRPAWLSGPQGGRGLDPGASTRPTRTTGGSCLADVD